MLDWYAMSATIGLIYADESPKAAAEKKTRPAKKERDKDEDSSCSLFI